MLSIMGLAANVVALHLSIEMDAVGLRAPVIRPISTRNDDLSALLKKRSNDMVMVCVRPHICEG